MQFLSTVKIVLSLLPLIIEAVKAIEAAFPEGGVGAKKLDMVKETLQSAYSVATDATTTFEQIWPAISGTVNAVVGLMNAVKK